MRACFYGTGDQRPGVAGIVQIIMQGFFHGLWNNDGARKMDHRVNPSMICRRVSDGLFLMRLGLSRVTLAITSSSGA